QCSRSNVTYNVVSADNCSTNVSIACVPPAGSTFPYGATDIICDVFDEAGNTNSCSFTVTVIDTEPPAITCPVDVTVSANPGSCFASGVALGNPIVTDSCGSVTVTNNAPAQFAFGTNVVTWTATDQSGNITTCQQRVIVNDTQPPTITCAADLNINANPGACFASGFALGNPTVSDNCGPVTVSSNAPAQFSVGTNVVVWTATDASGNTAACQQLIIVRDNQAPVIACPADISVNPDPGSCFATGVSLGNASASDNCGPVTVSNDAPAQFAVGTNVVTWTARDPGGNTTTCQQRVIVGDNQAPPIICPADIMVSAGPGSCFATGVMLGSPTVSDNCGPVTVASNAPAQFAVGTNLVTWTATDTSGNVAVCQQRVIVSDTQPPILTCPADVTVNANPGSCFATGVALGNPNTTDNCGTVTVTNNAPAQFPVGTTLVTWTASDASGNTTTCQQRVIVRDAEPPAIDCPGDVTVNASPGACFATGVSLGQPTASDNCGTATVTSNAPAQFAVGTNLVTWTATDTSGNTATCQQRVIVSDNQPPSITCPANMNVGAASGQNSVVINFASPVANDNCDASPSVTCAPSPGSAFGIGDTTVTCVATDMAGNSSSCAFTVTIAPAPPPQFGISEGNSVFNPQTGLFEQTVIVTNMGASTMPAVRLLIGGLRTGVVLYNAAGSDGGRPYVQHNAPVDPSTTISFLLEFYAPDRRPFTNSCEAVSVMPPSIGTNDAANISIDRSFLDTRIPGQPRYIIEFTTIPGRTYTIIYSDDSGSTWNAATPSLIANANRIQWYDDGPPKTISKPFSIQTRLYRVILAPANP
ncbi:MAG: HYR domain-containing protein, partial [Verrucomicrobia subdivision 3 bacterium]|nr:HYR domain-containing protein [Limisphaerales bacterium]